MKEKKQKAIRKPSFLLWFLVAPIVILYYRIHVKFRKNKIKIRSKSLVIAPHRAFFDFVTVPLSIYPKRSHVVGTTYWFRNKALSFLLNILGVIPKNQYKADMNAVLQMGRCFRRGDIVVMFPEGQMSSDGRKLILPQGLEKLIKKFKINVYYVDTKGAYFVSPKWDEKLGKRTTVYCERKLIVKEEEIDSLSVEEIGERIEKSFKDSYDFKFMEENPDAPFKRKNSAEGLEKILSYCPECHSKFTSVTDRNEIICSSCGYTLELNKENYFFKNNNRFLHLGNLLDYQKDEFIKEMNNGLVLDEPGFICTYDEKINKEDLGNARVIMDSKTIKFKFENEELVFELDKIVNFCVTLNLSFEVPTPQKTYRIYPVNGRMVYEFWKYMEYIKEGKYEGNN